MPEHQAILLLFLIGIERYRQFYWLDEHYTSARGRRKHGSCRMLLLAIALGINACPATACILDLARSMSHASCDAEH